jgi:hypothetical protein
MCLCSSEVGFMSSAQRALFIYYLRLVATFGMGPKTLKHLKSQPPRANSRNIMYTQYTLHTAQHHTVQ